MDEDANDSDESDGPTSEEIDALNHGHPLDNTNPPPLNNVGTRALNDVDTHAPGDANTYATSLGNNHLDGDRVNDDHPHFNTNLPMLPNEEDDDDCRPVETGPLMNEVRLASKKGQVFPPLVAYKS